MRARVQVDDSEAFAHRVRARYDPGTPCIAAGQSMGGLVAAQLVLRDQSAWAGLVLCSALIDADWTLILRCARGYSSHASAWRGGPFAEEGRTPEPLMTWCPALIPVV